MGLIDFILFTLLLDSDENPELLYQTAASNTPVLFSTGDSSVCFFDLCHSP